MKNTKQIKYFKFQVKEQDINRDGINDLLKFKFTLNMPSDGILKSVIFIAALDFQLKVCITTNSKLNIQF